MKDILVVLACALFLLMNIGALTNATRERAKRAVCLANLGRLTMAWHAFADDHNGNIVNGAAGINRPGEPAWVERAWGSGGQPPTLEELQAALKTGALWPYCAEVKLYRCPGGNEREVLSCAIVDSMNGYPQPGNTRGRGPVDELIVKNIRDIKDPASRIVFIEEIVPTPDSYAVHYDLQCWWDIAVARHNGGATFSFADGHTEHWKWKGRDTIEFGLNDPAEYGECPTTLDGIRDLVRVQIGVWGGLGYNPPVW